MLILHFFSGAEPRHEAGFLENLVGVQEWPATGHLFAILKLGIQRSTLGVDLIPYIS